MQNIIKTVEDSKSKNLTELQKEIKSVNQNVEFETIGKLNFVKLNTSKIIIGKSLWDGRWFVL